MAATGNVSLSAKAAGIGRTAAYEERARDARFAAEWDEAHESFLDKAEQEAFRRALRGVREPAGWYQGTPGGYVQRYSDTLLIFLLKGGRPEKYRDNVNHTGEVVSRVVIAGVGVPTQPQPPEE